MTKRSTSFFLVLVSLLFCLFSSTPLFAQEQDSEADQNEPSQADPDVGTRTGVLEEVITTGTRSTRPRTASDSTVPIDVLSGDAFDAYGGTNDITDNLKALVPSYTATPLTGDGSAFVRPTSLRGTAPDQTLVLVNGKRRHRSALLHFFAPAAGNGRNTARTPSPGS
jgi:iron complex outermembrane receptor protein